MNRRTRVTRDEAGVIQKFGVSPASIPDYLALVGDAADGYPGLPGWGAKSSAAVLARFFHLESIPADWREWHVNAAQASALAQTLSRERDRALLFRTLATLRTDIALFDDGGRAEVERPHSRFRRPRGTIRRGRDGTRPAGGPPVVGRARPPVRTPTEPVDFHGPLFDVQVRAKVSSTYVRL